MDSDDRCLVCLACLLDDISVDSDWEYAREAGNTNWPAHWHALVDETGIVAYFADEADAFAYRLYLINMRLNAADVLQRYAAPAVRNPRKARKARKARGKKGA